MRTIAEPSLLRRLLATGAVLTLVGLLLAGCGGSDDDGGGNGGGGGAATEKKDEKIEIGVFVASSANSYFAANIEGIKEAAEKAGNATVTVFDGQFNANTQVNQLRDALLSKRFNVWLVAPVDGGPVAPVVKQALDQDITVGCILTPCGADVANQEIQVPGVAIQTGFGYTQSGKDLGDLTVKACGEKDPCEVFWLPGNPQQPLETARQDGLYSVIKKDPKIDVVAVQAGEYLPGPAHTATQNVLQAHPNVDVIVSSGDQMISGAYRAAAAAGKAEGIRMMGMGCTIEAAQMIKQGKVFACVATLPRTEGRVAGEEVIAVARGKESEGIVVNPVDDTTTGRIITKENVDEFEPEFHS